MEIFDIHAHIYPDQIAPKATASVQDFYQLGDKTMDGTEQMLMERGRAAGISGFLVLPVAIRPDRVRSINRFILDRVSSNHALVGFGTVHAAMDGIVEEARWIREAGLKGIKMHPDSQRFAIDDLRLFPLYEEIQGKLPVLLHMGDQRYDYSHPIKLRRILDLFPRLQVIAAHFGGYSMYDTACDLLHDTSCVFDISSSLRLMEKGRAEWYINIYGAERLAFGTDYPMWDPVTEVEQFLSLDITWEQKEQIASKTAKRILGI